MSCKREGSVVKTMVAASLGSVDVTLVVEWVGCVVGCGEGCGMHGTAALMYDGVEAVVVVSCVGDCADRTVWLYQAVLSLHHIAVTLLPLVLHIPRVVILHAVVVGVLGVRLQTSTYYLPILS